jgi:uncharacterized protein
MRIGFEWNSRKASSNLARHGVSFEDAASVFFDPLARIFDDEDHAWDEHREIIVGHSRRDHLLVICFIERGDTVRIISARKATRNERKDYEEGVTP